MEFKELSLRVWSDRLPDRLQQFGFECDRYQVSSFMLGPWAIKTSVTAERYFRMVNSVSPTHRTSFESLVNYRVETFVGEMGAQSPPVAALIHSNNFGPY